MLNLITNPKAILSIIDLNFKCPQCECPHLKKDYYHILCKSKQGLIYKKCRGCENKLGITIDMQGDVRVWLKEDEHKEGLLY